MLHSLEESGTVTDLGHLLYPGRAHSESSRTAQFIGRYDAAAAAAKSLQSCPTLCDPIVGSPPGSAVPGIL